MLKAINSETLNKFQIQKTLGDFPQIIFQLKLDRFHVDKNLFNSLILKMKQEYLVLEKANKSYSKIFCKVDLSSANNFSYKMFAVIQEEYECKYISDVLKLNNIASDMYLVSDKYHILTIKTNKIATEEKYEQLSN